ncbi:MAG: CCA tRNA nucleotidyltransferase, partial [Planctomycetes bacterium]|nr:CCA tRNA nucleotidyltransferase [Planctomycetota bacterium]
MPRAPLEPRAAAAWVARKLREAGHRSLFAGGCVRDSILGHDAADFDVATSAIPAEIRQIFPRAIGVGESFGVMLVRHGGRSIEVATFRADGVYVDGRRPDAVRFSD